MWIMYILKFRPQKIFGIGNEDMAILYLNNIRKWAPIEFFCLVNIIVRWQRNIEATKKEFYCEKSYQ